MCPRGRPPSSPATPGWTLGALRAAWLSRRRLSSGPAGALWRNVGFGAAMSGRRDRFVVLFPVLYGNTDALPKRGCAAVQACAHYHKTIVRSICHSPALQYGLAPQAAPFSDSIAVESGFDSQMSECAMWQGAIKGVHPHLMHQRPARRWHTQCGGCAAARQPRQQRHRTPRS